MGSRKGCKEEGPAGGSHKLRLHGEDPKGRGVHLAHSPQRARPGASAWDATPFGPQTGTARGLDTATDPAAITLGLVPPRKASTALAADQPPRRAVQQRGATHLNRSPSAWVPGCSAGFQG